MALTLEKVLGFAEIRNISDNLDMFLYITAPGKDGKVTIDTIYSNIPRGTETNYGITKYTDPSQITTNVSRSESISPYTLKLYTQPFTVQQQQFITNLMNGNGAINVNSSQVTITDANNVFNSTTVEGALNELYQLIQNISNGASVAFYSQSLINETDVTIVHGLNTEKLNVVFIESALDKEWHTYWFIVDVNTIRAKFAESFTGTVTIEKRG